MSNVEDVFEWIVDGFNNATFAQQQLIKCVNILNLHVYQKCRYPLNAALRQQFARVFGNIVPVAKQIAGQGLDPFRHGFSVVNVAGRHPKIQDFTLVVDD